jgi:hypothetical protein
MANTVKPNSGHVPVTSAEEVRHFAGPVTDHTVTEILGIHPTMDELEIAALHARGQSGRPEKSVGGRPTRHPRRPGPACERVRCMKRSQKRPLRCC